MSSQLGAISSVNALIGKVFTQPKGDLAGRLNSRTTVAILAISSVLLLTTHFWGDPIACWSPAEFPSKWSDFINQYCYVHGTYFFNLNEPLDYNRVERQRISIDYYQWVPYVLVLQALLFYMPRFVWKMLSAFSGYDLPAAVQYVDQIWHQIKSSNFQSRMEVMDRHAAVFLWDGIRLSKRRHRGQLALHYILYTIVQAINASLMFLWLNWLIDSPIYSWSGPSILLDFYNGLTWQETGHFPRITHCDVSVRKVSSVQMETVLCVLTLNIYYEKLLLFLWFWMLFVAGVSWMNCLSWLRALFVPSTSRHRLQTLITAHAGGSSFYTDRFFRELGADGIFILQQVALNVGELPTSYLSLAMYKQIENSDGSYESSQLLQKSHKEV